VIAQRVKQLGMSATLRISALAQEMRAAGIDVLDFSAGQPDFPTPPDVREAGKRAIDENQTRYTANPGLIELRKAVAETILREQGVEYAPEQVLVSSGAKASLYFACMALLDPGDEMLVPVPYWVSYPEQVRLTQAEPVFVDCPESNRFKLVPDALEAAVTPRTKALMLNYPSNPTGVGYSREELEPIAALCVRHDLWVVADEIYSKLLFDGRRFTSIASLGDEIRARTITIDGVSKTYSMTGWRIGWAAGPKEIVTAMAKIQSHSTSNAATPSQWAALAALHSSADEVTRRAAAFQERRDETLRLLGEIPGLSCVVPEGTFYAFPNVSAYLAGGGGDARMKTGGDLAQYLLEEAKVAVIPGDAFGADRHIRISFAVSVERVREGMQRIAGALARLPRG
jgi:aspartate/methionine/tyrosine aminotransferase